MLKLFRKILLQDPAYMILSVACVLAAIFVTQSYRNNKILEYQIAFLKKQVEELRNLQIGDVVPSISGTDMEGNVVRVTLQEGKPYFLIIYSLGCEACELQEISVWNRLAAQARARGYSVYGVSLDPLIAARTHLKKYQFDFESIFVEESFKRGYRAYQIPQMLLLDHIGKVKAIRSGTIQAADEEDFAKIF